MAMTSRKAIAWTHDQVRDTATETSHRKDVATLLGILPALRRDVPFAAPKDLSTGLDQNNTAEVLEMDTL